MSEEIGSIHVDMTIDTKNLESSLTRVGAGFRNLDNNMISSTRNLAGVGSAVDKNVSGWQRLSSTLDPVGQKFQSIGGQMSRVGQSMSMYLTLPMAAVGAAGIKAGMEFEQGMQNIKALGGATGEELNKLKALALEMGTKTKFGATEAAKGIEELAKAGLKTEQILNGGLRGALYLATAGEISLGEAAGIASTALQAFKADNLSVSDAANILAGGANAAYTDVRQLQMGLAQVGAVASGVGLSFRDTASGIALFSNNGLMGSDAGTSLKSMLLNLQPESDKQTQLFKQLGIVTADGSNKFFDASQKIRSLSEIAEVLKTSLAGLTDQQRLAALNTMFGSDAIRAANILYKEGAVGVKDMQSAMSNTTAEQVANEKMKTLSGSLTILKNNFNELMIKMYEAQKGPLMSLATSLNDLVTKFQNLSPSMQQTILITSGIAVAIGPLIVIFGTLISSIGTIGTAISGLITMFGGLSASIAAAGGIMAVLTGPVGIAVAALVGFGAAVIYLWNTNEQFKNFVISVWNQIVSAVSVTLNQIRTTINDVMTFINSTVTNNWSTIMTVWNIALYGIQNIVVNVFEIVKGIILATMTIISGTMKTISAVIKGDWEGAWNGIRQIISGALAFIQAVIMGGMNAIMNTVKAVLVAILAAFGVNFNQAKTIVDTVFRSIQAVISSVMAVINGIIKVALEMIMVSFRVTFNIISTVVSSVFGIISNVVGAGMNLIKGIVMVAMALLKGDWSAAWNAIKQTASNMLTSIVGIFRSINLFEIGKNIIAGLINGIKSMVGAVVKAAADVVSSIKSTITGTKGMDIRSPSRVTYGYGVRMIEGLVNGIRDNISQVGDTVKLIGEDAKNAFANAREWIDTEEFFDRLTATDKLNAWGRVLAKVGSDTKEYTDALKELYKTQKQILAESFEESKDWIENEDFYGRLTDSDKLNAWQRVLNRMTAGTKEYEEALRNVYKAQQEIQNQEFSDSFKYIEDKKFFNSRDIEQELQILKDLLPKAFEQGNTDMFEKIYKQIFTLENEKKNYIEKNMKQIEAIKQESNERLAKIETEYYDKVEERNKKLNDDINKVNSDRDKKIQDRQKKLNDDVVKLNEEYADKISNVNKKLNEDIRKSNDEYEKALKDRENAIYESFNLFDEGKIKKINGGLLAKNLRTQLESYKVFQSAIDNLRSRGASNEFVNELQEMGVKSVSEINAINNMSDKELQQYVGMWTEKHRTAKEQSIEELEGMKVQTVEKIKQLKVDANIELTRLRDESTQKIRELRINARIDMEQMRFEALNTVKDMVREADKNLKDYKDTFDKNIADLTKSTTTELEKLAESGKGIGEGLMNKLIEGIKAMEQPLKDKIKSVKAMIDDVASSYSSMFNVGNTPVKSGATLQENIGSIKTASASKTSTPNVQVMVQGNVVGQGGIKELATTVSKVISSSYGVRVGGAY